MITSSIRLPITGTGMFFGVRHHFLHATINTGLAGISLCIDTY